jgi:uncharacterized coiled-coil DUF342 family protein
MKDINGNMIDEDGLTLGQRFVEAMNRISELERENRELSVRVEDLTEKADRGCHSICLHDEEYGWSHYPDCCHEELRALREKFGRLTRECERLNKACNVKDRIQNTTEECYNEKEARVRQLEEEIKGLKETSGLPFVSHGEKVKLKVVLAAARKEGAKSAFEWLEDISNGAPIVHPKRLFVDYLKLNKENQ